MMPWTWRQFQYARLLHSSPLSFIFIF
jgi:hypothetical protein